MSSTLPTLEPMPAESELSRARTPVLMRREEFLQLGTALTSRGYELIGPQVRDSAIVYEKLASFDQLPAGWSEEQSGGHYRLKQQDNGTLFGYTVGPHSWKAFLYPAHRRLWCAERSQREVQVIPEAVPVENYALVGVRACELEALSLYDQVTLHTEYPDPYYQSVREGLFIVAVNCTAPSGTCFCASMKAGPRNGSGYDLVVTEISGQEACRYLVEAGSERGAEVLSQVPHQAANEADLKSVETLLCHAAAHMGRSLETRGLKELLYRNHEHPIWDSIAERCLTCGNCTMVCPTCFCTTVEDTTDLSGTHAERWRRWDSCFTLDYSYIHGGSVRVSAKSRYRQWLTHKLGAWNDQFGRPGCVGCGRCITWCPVGIDITAELRVLRESELIGPEEFSRSPHDSSNA